MTFPLSNRWFLAIVFALGFFLTLLVQHRNGFYARELGSDPDEPAHAVTSLMVRDYVATAAGTNPLRYAQEYYRHYPKVALGHYPPFYYLVAGLWLLPVPSVTALGILQAALTAALIATSALLLMTHLPRWASAGLALSWSLMPFMQKQSSMVMADTLLALLCLWSVMVWGRFVERRQKRDALLFGFLAALAILTKGSAWLLGAVPPLHILLSRSWALLRDWRMWLAPLPVLVLAVPWQLYSSKITARGMSNETAAEHLQNAASFYSEALPRTLSWPVALAFVGAAIVFGHRWRRSAAGSPADPSTLLTALVLSALLLLFVVPVGFTTRYLMPLFYPVFIVSCIGLWKWRPWSILPVLAAAALLADAPEPQRVSGYHDAMHQIQVTSASDDDLRVFVLSDARGEGSLIATAAFEREPDAGFSVTLFRASKELADQDWLGRNYQAKTASADEVSELLKKKAVDWLVIDHSVTTERQAPYFALVSQVLAIGTWKHVQDIPVTRTPGATGRLALYQPQKL
jgi:hypothetical protein